MLLAVESLLIDNLVIGGLAYDTLQLMVVVSPVAIKAYWESLLLLVKIGAAIMKERERGGREVERERERR